MKRIVGLLLSISIIGCCAPGDRESLKPLPEKGPALSYQEIFTRARAQTSAVSDAFYADNWLELEQAAQVLEQTARFLPKTSDQPKNVQAVLVKESDELRQQAARLIEGARAKSVPTINEQLQKLQMTLRALRPE